MDLKTKDMSYDQALYIAKEIVKWQKFIGILKVETSCEVIEILLNQIDTLKKGIDELIKKYEGELQALTWIKGITADATAHNINSNIKKEFYEIVLQDLKKLKGE